MANINESNAPTESTNEESIQRDFRETHQPPTNLEELILEIDDVVQIGDTPVYKLNEAAVEWFSNHPLRVVLERSLMEASERAGVLMDYLSSLDFTPEGDVRPAPDGVWMIKTGNGWVPLPIPFGDHELMVRERIPADTTNEEMETRSGKPSLEDILRDHKCGPHCVTTREWMRDGEDSDEDINTDDKPLTGEKSQPPMSEAAEAAIDLLKKVVAEGSGFGPGEKLRAAELLLMYGR